MSGPLLVLGAGEDQLPAYREARRRGLVTIAVDQRTDRPALAVADHFVKVSTRDPGAVAAALGPTVPDAVVSLASDACLRSWHTLSEHYGTRYRFPSRAADASEDKRTFHELAESLGLPRYRWAESDDPEQVTSQAGELRLPLVIKPVDSSGGKGAQLVTDPSRIAAAVRHAREFSYSGAVLAEEFVAGRNLTVEIFMRDGTAHFTAITEKRLTGGARMLIGGHTCPAPVELRTRAMLATVATRLSLAMGVTDGPVNYDVILTPDATPYVLEAGARLCGNGYPRLLRAVYGVDTVAALLSLALGEPFELVGRPARHGILHVITSPLGVPGELVASAGIDDVRRMPGVCDAELFLRPGDPVLPFTQSAHKVGYLIVTGDSPSQTEDRLVQALGTLRLTVVPVAGPQTGPEGELDAVDLDAVN
jgi:biotin carboxylase